MEESGRVKKVLFVCVENSCRSQIAEAFARIHGLGLIEAFSAGSRPSGEVNPNAVENMCEIGYNLSSHQSKSLDEIPKVVFDYVITMGCGDECPVLQTNHREDWDIPDPKAMSPDEFRTVRDLIEAKVKELIAKF
jgi:protein-tyrosine-phosphatase